MFNDCPGTWICAKTTRSLLALGPSISVRRGMLGSGLEKLEPRTLTAAAPIDGVGNNILHPEWGSAGVDLLRIAPAGYSDGISSPAGAGRPSARAISNAIANQLETTALNDRSMSAMVYAFGQFIDHDLDLTNPGSEHLDPGDPSATGEHFDVAVPVGDPLFDPNSEGGKTISLGRSEFDLATGTAAGNPRQQFNEITAYLDGSVIYGTDNTRLQALRTFSGGELKTSSGDMLPFNTDGLENQNVSPLPDDQLFLAGDQRANENIEMTAMQTLFLREHNQHARQIAALNPSFTDDEVFQAARRIVVGELQAITYNEFLPALLGKKGIKPYKGYKPTVNPGIANEFSTAAYRVGHTMLGDDVEFLDNDGNEVSPELELKDAFFNPAAVTAHGIGPILKYLSTDNANEIDNQLVDDVRNFLFGPPGAGGFDLASLNIERGRDHGLADYNSTRAAYGLPRVKKFSDITSDTRIAAALQEQYGAVDNIDLWVGGLAENHVKGSSVGPLLRKIIADQFQRIRDGDRFFYKNVFAGDELKSLESVTLASVIERNTNITNLQDNVFIFNATVAGTVFNDKNGDGILQKNERTGVRGAMLTAVDDEGNTVATATTDKKGRFTMNSLGITGDLTITCTPPSGLTVFNGTQQIHISRGGITQTTFAVSSLAYPI